MVTSDLKALLGIAIKTERSVLGISQEELAERAGLHRTYVSDVERGARNPSIASIEKLAQALKLSVTALFERASDEHGSNGVVEILLVEDNPRDVSLTMRAFKKAQIANPVHVVGDGSEALDFLFARGHYGYRQKDDHPKVILLDLNLPKVPGLEVLRRIKADARTRHIPVIILTVSSRDRDISECRRLGAETYIVKPVGFQNFSEVTRHVSLAWTLVKRNGPTVAQPVEGYLNHTNTSPRSVSTSPDRTGGFAPRNPVTLTHKRTTRQGRAS
jgi:two-component system, response regulator